tara:strand:+ start:55 stop:1971 length:1917 start_codon:yes stop_codon:yes gene_type:complete
LKLSNFIGSLPAYWCLFEALELSLLRSKEPSWLGLYSTPKAFVILVLLTASFIILRFISPIISAKLDHIPFGDSLKNISALKIFFILLILTRLALINAPCSVGEDVAQQVLTTRQWVEGESSSPNFLSSPQHEDLSSIESNWILRPPGASWIPLPGLLLGLSVGHSIHISLFILSIAFGTGWLKLARTLSLPMPCLQVLAFLLAVAASLGSLSLSTASVITSATFPWLLICSLHFGEQWNSSNQKFKIHLLTFLFFFAIGAHAFFKLSSLLTVSAIVMIPFSIWLTNCRKITLIFCTRVIVGMILFFIPYFLISEYNKQLSGINSDELYSQQDYNAQHELWGEYFTESTRGGMLVASLFASTGYATPIQSLTHGFRNLLLQSEYYTSTLHSYEINPRILGCCILAIPFTLVIFTALWKIKDQLSSRERILYYTLFVVPFLGFTLVSYHHGYNYLIYPSYTKEFAMIFLIFGLSYSAHSNKIIKHQFIGNLLMVFLITLPIISTSKVFCRTLKDSFLHSLPSQYERQQNLGQSKFSKSFQRIEDDSNSSLDICLFLCAGGQGDYMLRTPMNTLSLHFAKGNLNHFPAMNSSRPLNVYCLFDPRLANDISFVQSVIDKFPTAERRAQLDLMTWKVELKSF